MIRLRTSNGTISLRESSGETGDEAEDDDPSCHRWSRRA